MRTKRAPANDIGIVEPAEACVASVRRQSVRVRLVAAVVLTVFATVSLATTIHSLGAYCLTSGNGRVGLLRF